jgi:hypothetical protein
LLKCGTYLFVIDRDNDNIKEAIKVELRISCSIQSPVSPKADVRLSPVNISVSKHLSSSKYLFELVWYASITKAISESKKNYQSEEEFPTGCNVLIVGTYLLENMILVPTCLQYIKVKVN